MTIYILLPVRNRKAITRGFVECLVSQTYLDYRLILIDDGSTDGTAEMVLAHIPSATVLRGTGNWWWAGSLQRGLNWLKDRQPDPMSLVLLINDDVTFKCDYLERAARMMSTMRDVLLLSQFREADGQISETGVHVNLRELTFEPARSASDINCLSTKGLFIYWRDVLKIGDFHPTLLPHYLSDYEYTIRAYKKGLKCVTSPDLLIAPNHDTTGYHYFEEKNFITFVKKFFSKKSAANPVYWSSFIFLTFSSPWALRNLGRLWRNVFRQIVHELLRSKRPLLRNR